MPSTPRRVPLVSIRRKVNIGVAGALLVLTVVGLVSYRTTTHLVQTADWVAHTHDVIARLEAISASGRDMESARRGFVLTGEETYLQPYRLADEVLTADLGHLSEMVADSAEQSERVAELRRLTEAHRASIQRSIALKRAGDKGAAEQDRELRVGRELVNQRRGLMLRMKQQEEKYLEERDAQVKTTARRATEVIGASSLLAFLLVLVGGVMINRDVAQRQRVETELRQARHELESRVTQRTEELTAANGDLQREVGEHRLAEKALESLRQRMQLILDSAGEGIYGLDLDGRVTFINPAATRMLGYAADELLGKDAPHREHACQSGNCPDDCNKSLHEKAENEEFRRKDGGVFPAECVSTSMHDGETLVGTVVVFKDITRRRRDEAELRRAHDELELRVHERTADLTAANQDLVREIEQRETAERSLRETLALQRAILDGANYSIISSDPHGIIRSINAAAQRWLGYRADELIGRTTPAIIHDPDEVARRAAQLSVQLGEPIAATVETFIALPRRGQTDEHEWTYIRKDGTRFPVLLSVTALRDDEGGITGFMGIAGDISARKQAEEELNRFFTLSLDMLCIAGFDGYFKRLNPAWTATLGWSEEEMRSRPYLSFVHPDDRERTQAEARHMAEGRVTIAFENRYQCKDGTHRWLSWTAAPFPQSQLTYAVAHDTTERKQAEVILAAQAEDLARSERSLREQTVILHSVLDSMADAVMVVNDKDEFLVFNRAARRLHGNMPPRRGPADWADCFHLFQPDQVTPFAVDRLPIVRALRGEWADGVEMYVRAPDAARGTWISANARPMRDADGIVRGGVVVQHDITERKHAERELATHHAITRVLADAPNLEAATRRILQVICDGLGWDFGGLWQRDRDKDVLVHVDHWAREGLDLSRFGARTREVCFAKGIGLPGRAWERAAPVWIPDVTADTNFLRTAAARAEGLHSAIAFPIRHGAEVMGVVDFFSQDLREEPSPELVQMFATIGGQIGQFIERKQAERELRRTRGHLTDALESLDGGLVMFGPDERLLICNRQYREMYPEAEPLMRPGTPYEAILRGFFARGGHMPGVTDVDAWVAERLAEVRQAPSVVEQQLDHRWVRISDSRTSEGGVVSLRTDITALKQMQEDLCQARDAAEAGSRAKSDFLARMSHELRTPLNSVIGFANILLKNKAKNLREQDLTYLHRILDNGKHLLALINNILDLSKVEAGRMEVEWAEVSLNALIPEVLNQIGGQPRAKEVKLQADIPLAVASLRTDAGKLKQVLINLVANALKFTEKGSVTLRVGVEPESRRPIYLDVVDTGIGIPKDRQAAIFEAFQQADNSTTRKYGGTGLGLTISRSLCQLLGYQVDVSSEVGQGSTFRVWLGPRPTATDDDGGRPAPVRSVTAPPPAPIELTPPPTRMTAGKRVLVIDDESDSRILMMNFLEEAGYRVMTAGSGDEGLQLARQHRPDLITLDLMMPGKSGWEVLKELKADPSLQGIPVVVVSIVARDQGGLVMGAVDLLDKPLTRDKLNEVLRRNLRPRGGKVLIVEDDEDCQRLLAASLSEEGAELRAVSDGAQALALLETFSPDLVLLDLKMPVMDGTAFLEAVRRDPRYEKLPIVVVTAQELTAEQGKQLASDTAGVVHKGEDMETVLKQLVRQFVGGERK